MLREQVITPRAGRVSAQQRGGARAPQAGGAQRPATRRGASAPKRTATKRGSAWRALAAWMPFIGKTLLAICLGLGAFELYTTAAASTFFTLRTVDVGGASRASSEQLEAVVRHTAGPAGVWRADLEAIRAELERQPWVRSAVVARVLPSGLRVRISERAPRAVARATTGRLVWVDDDGIIVGAFAPTDQLPAFILRGFDETESTAARAENRLRVAKFLELQHEWTAAGLGERVSEVNLDDLHDVRAQLAGADAQIEVRLGRDDLTKRLRLALQTLDEQRQTPRGALISYIDMTQGKRAVVGFMRAQLPAAGAETNADDADTAPRSAAERPRRAG